MWFVSHSIQAVSENVMRSDCLQDQMMALQLKLKEEEIMRKKSAEDYRKMAGELVKVQSKQEELQVQKKEVQTERNQLALKNEELIRMKSLYLCRNQL